jgi:hypothetical protein
MNSDVGELTFLQVLIVDEGQRRQCGLIQCSECHKLIFCLS